MICGVFIGIGYNYFEYSNDTFIQFCDILGDGYIALLKMLIIPIVLVSIIHSIVNLKNHTESYIIKVAYKTVAIMLVLTAIGSIVAILMHTGSGIDIASITGKVTQGMKTATFSETILSFLPDNLFHQMDSNNVMAVVVFAILLGFAILIAHRENKRLTAPFISFIESLFFIIKKLAKIVIATTPYGILGLMV